MDAGALVISGLTSLLVFYVIIFDICATGYCGALDIMKVWVSLTWLFIPYGLAQLGVGFFLARARELERIYRLAIVVSGLLGTALAGMAIFGVVAEVEAVR